MAVKVRPHPRGGWDVDVMVMLVSGDRFRERRKLPASCSKTAAREWGERRERELLIQGPKARKEVPTLEAFAPRFIEGHAKANRQKPSGVNQKQMVLRVHLMPVLGRKRLDAITNEDVQRLKHRLLGKSPRTVNNVLTVLNVLLKKAVEWDVIERMPATIRLLTVPTGSTDFYDFEEYERLVQAAAGDRREHLIVLLGGEAGLRAGEMRALQWGDIRLDDRQLCVSRGEWRGQVTTPKGGRQRFVPMTERLTAALRSARSLKGPWVLCRDDGTRLNENQVRHLLERATRRAGLRFSGPHILRHTFCSHLAMQGAPVGAIQRAAGHADLTMTQRYMHLSPAAIESAIALLDRRPTRHRRGDNLETDVSPIAKSS